MRRLVLFGLAVVLSGLLVASAAALDVDGGALQVFRVDVELPRSVSTSVTTLSLDPNTTYLTTTTLTATTSTVLKGP